MGKKDKDTIDFLIQENLEKGERIRELEELSEQKDAFFKEMISDGLRHGSSLAGKHMNDLKDYYSDPEGYQSNNDDDNKLNFTNEKTVSSESVGTIFEVAAATVITVVTVAPHIKKAWHEKIKPKAIAFLDRLFEEDANSNKDDSK